MLYNIALSQLKGVGIATANKLLELTEGNSEALFKLSAKELSHLGTHVQKLLSENAKNAALKNAEQELNFIEKHNITPLYFKDKGYPTRLKDCKGAPIILYSKGTADLNTIRCLSVVGTRQPTQNGIATTKALLKEIANLFSNTLIISGLAYGIDVTAHKAALFHKLPTVAVLGHGLQMLYPAAHKSIAQRIVEENGALLTPYVVESKAKGGAMATAQIAHSYGRDVLAVPGNINEDKSKGCNKLIKTQIAALIESAKDIGYSLNWELKNTASQPQLLFELSEEEQKVTTVLQQRGKVNLDTLSAALNIPTQALLAIITQLEFKDLLIAHPGKFYSLKK